ncbi:MAG: metalloregulator ArsR/SmtB family transcription factor [Desulfovibrionaceae bacterium]|nr:metalloregulator ArsR/SmtB family transcription factor [Desulfovibrionaceae bacterium]
MLKQIVPTISGGATAERLARICKVLAVDTRVRMLEMLAKRQMCVGALARALSITPAAVSQHLRILRDAGAVVADKQGYFVHYRADPGTLAAWGRETAAFFAAGQENPEAGESGAARPPAGHGEAAS